MDLKKRLSDLTAARAQYATDAQASIDRQQRIIGQQQEALRQTEMIARDTLAKADGQIALCKELMDEERAVSPTGAPAPSGGPVASMPAQSSGAAALDAALAAEGYPTEEPPAS